MAYRNGTYVTFHANNTSDPTKSDMKYYGLLQAWAEHKSIEFEFVNSHEKTNAVRDSSKKKTLEDSLKTRLRNSKHMILILGDSTKYDDDWVPFEIKYGVDVCQLPIFVVYTDYDYILDPLSLSYHWPSSLTARINNNSVRTIHIPFNKETILYSINNYSINNLPPNIICWYLEQQYREWGETIVPNIKNWRKLF